MNASPLTLVSQTLLSYKKNTRQIYPSFLVQGSRIMASTTTNEAKISIKVLVDTVENRVVYAEADHNFVDVLFSFMSLPMGAIVRLLGEKDDKKFESLGSLNNLYQSLVDLPVNYFSTEECNFILLNPASSSYDNCRNLKLNIDDTGPMKYFACGNWNHAYFTKFVALSICNTTECEFCEMSMGCEIWFKYATSSATDGCLSSGVFVSDATNFIVTDDLRVMPYSLESCIQLLKDVGITDTIHLEERTVDICREQVLDLLRLSTSFTSSLTYLVLHRTQPFPDFVHPEQGNFDPFTFITKEVSESPKIFLEVFLQKSTGKLLFAEAEEDFVEFVFGFLAISLGTVIGTLMDGTSSLVCMDNIFESISNMSIGRHFKSQSVKDSLLKPHYGHEYVSKNCIFPLKKASVRKVYVSLPAEENWNWRATSFFTFDKYESDCVVGSVCVPMSGGLFKPSGKFVVADDLVITPPKSVSSSDYLMKLKVPLNDIEQHKVGVGLEEGLRMLKASLGSSSTVLSIGLEHQLKKLNPNF